MHQKEGESIAQYYVPLRLQVSKCSFADLDDAIRIIILQTMRDKKLRREAMVKRYTLLQLLEQTQQTQRISTGRLRTWKKHYPLKQFQQTEYTSGDPKIPREDGTKRNLHQSLTRKTGTFANIADLTTKDQDSSAQHQERHTQPAPRKVILQKCAKGNKKAKMNKPQAIQRQIWSSQNKTALQTLIVLSTNSPPVHVQATPPRFMF